MRPHYEEELKINKLIYIYKNITIKSCRIQEENRSFYFEYFAAFGMTCSKLQDA